MLNAKQLPHAIRFALLAGAASTMGIASTAVAQQEEAATLDRIQVTGSRIRQVDIETAQPVLTISRAEIEQQGFSSVADILQNISAAGTPPLSRASPLSSGEAAGGTFISLRNLGAQRTLVLVNGKRLGITTGGLQDISQIPAVAIERVEVLKDGASSLYGSDAIGGVVNIITRTNYEGAQAGVYVGQYSQGDGDTLRYDMVVGAVGPRSSVTIAAEYASEDAIPATNRPFSAFPRSERYPELGWTAVGKFGGFVTSAARPVPGVPNGTRVVLREGGDWNNPADFRAQNVSGTSSADKSNTNEQTDLRTGQTRRNLYMNGLFDVTDNTRVRLEGMFNNRVTDRQVAGYPMQAAAFGTPLAGNSFFNPYDTAIPNWWRRSWEVPRTAQTDATSLRMNVVLEGSFEIGTRFFDWDVGYLTQDNRIIQQGRGDWNVANTAAAVGPSFFNAATGRVECGTAANPIPYGAGAGACVPFNPFLGLGQAGDGSLADPLLQEFLFQETHARGRTRTDIVSANISTFLFSLPAGDLGFAAGVERRKEYGKFTPDALAVSGNSTTLAARGTEGGYSVEEVYVEFEVPLLADVAFARDLRLNVSSRYSDYDTFGDTTNSKFGLQWRPIDELLVRATYAQGFRAPTVANLFAGGSQTFAFYQDPCDVRPGFGQSTPGSAVRTRCAADIANAATFEQLGQGFTPTTVPNAQTPVAFFSGAANPNLTPEESRSRNAGIVWSPNFVQNLNISLDWWNIRIDNTIVGDTPNQILRDCYVDNIASRCALFTRDPAQGFINNMVYGSRNAGFIETEGWDFGVNYRFDTAAAGRFGVNWDTTYTSFYDFRSTDDANAPVSSTVSLGSDFRIRSNAQLTWDLGDFGATWGMRYYSAIKEACLSATLFPEECSNPTWISSIGTVPTPQNRTGSNTFNDVQFRWRAPWNATVSVGANNVFNRYGPNLYSQPSSNVSYYGGFDIGRFYYMNYQQRF